MKKKLWTGSALFVGAAMLGVLALSGGEAEAETHDVDVEATITTTLVESVVRGVNFGTIDLIPATEDEVIVMDASSLSTTSNAGLTGELEGKLGSMITEFTFETGLITVASAFDLDNVEVTYTAAPQTLTGLVDGAAITIAAVETNSIGGANSTSSNAGNTNPLTKQGGQLLNIHIGGALTIPPNTPNDTYAGTIPVTISYN